MPPHGALAATLPAVAAAVLAAVPGFGVLDYHACLALSPVVGLCAAHLALGSLTGRLPPPRWAWPLLLAGPLAVLLLASLWIPNCNRLYGFAFYALGPLTSALVGAGLATLAVLLAPVRVAGSVRHGLAVGLLYALVALSTLRPIAAFYWNPQVFAWHGLVGHIAGALYEDAVAITWSWCAFRMLDLALWGPLVAVAVTLHRAGQPIRPRTFLQSARAVGAVRAALGLSLLAVVVTELRAGPERWRVPVERVEQALPVRVEILRRDLRLEGDGAALVLHLPKGRWLAQERENVIEDAAFRYAGLVTWFGRAPTAPIEAFFYPSAGSKRRWMGADRVDMAKPWLQQVHLILPELGASVLTHEFAHVFAAAMGPPPFGVPLQHGLVPHAVLIEGVAVAAEWPLRGGLDPHRWSRAMRQLGLAPELSSLFTPTGFFAQNSDRAYTLSGSFLRWLRDTRGMPVVERLYRTADVTAATGTPLAELAAAWGRFVDDPKQHPLTQADLDRAQARFERPGLFFRPCALEVGRCLDRVGHLWQGGNDEQAVEQWRDLVARVENVGGDAAEPELALGYAASRSRVGDAEGARTLLDRLLALPEAAGVQPGNPRQNQGPPQPRLNRLQRAAALIVRGDLSLQAGDVQAAQADWQAAAALPVSEATLRTLEVKRHLVRNAAGRQAVVQLLAAGGPAGPSEPVLDALHAALPDSPFATYLWARRALVDGDTQAGAMALETLPALLPPDAVWTRREAVRLVGLHRARRGDCKGLEAWWQAHRSIALPGELQPPWLDELRGRCAWQAHRAFKPGR